MDRRLAPMNEAMAAAVMFFMVAALLGPIVPIMVAACTAGLILLDRESWTRWRPLLLLAALPLWAVASCLWSPGPGIVLKYAIQLLLTVVALLAAAAALRPAAFLRAILWASLLCCVLSIASGIQGPSTKGMVLVGITGSKDSMASCAYLLLVSGAAVALWRAQPGPARLAGLAGIPIAVYLIATTQAASLIVASVATVAIAAMLAIFHLLPRRGRIPALVLAALLLSPAVAYQEQIMGAVSTSLLDTFEKDRTLTGRTLLWDVARARSAERPTLGWGYRYIFMSYDADTIGMIHSQRIVDARTFNFHSTWWELRADLGWIGLMLGALSLGGSLLLLLYRAAFDGGAFWIAGASYAAATLARSAGETLFQAFSVYGPLLLAWGGYALLSMARSAGSAAWRRRYRRDRAEGSGQAVIRRMS